MKLALALALAAAAASPAVAQDWIVYGGGEIEFLFNPDGAGSGTTSSLSAYAEAEMSGFYLGALGKVVNDSASNELDLYLGYRNELASGFSYDLYYTRYFYPNDSASNYGEIGFSLGQPLGDQAAISLDAYYDHDNRLGSVYAGAEFYATDRVTISANYGTYEVAGAGNEQEWDLGASYALSDEAAVDLRYYDGTEYVDSYFGLSLSFDTTLFGG